MSLFQLALRNIAGRPFRSTMVLLCAVALSGLFLGTALLVQGAEGSLKLATARLGADIVVVGEGAETRVENALVMGTPTSVWIPATTLDGLGAVPGVGGVSPQLYLSSLYGASCCSVWEMFLVAYEPHTDFTLTPWLRRELGDELRPGEAIGGSDVFVPEGDEGLKLYGSLVRLRGNLAPTGTNLDHSLFFTFETAYQIARDSYRLAERPLEIPPNSISAALVKVRPEADAHEVALRILEQVPGTVPIESPDLFRSFRSQIRGLSRGMLAVVGVTTGLSLLLMGLVFALAVHERRREVGVLRALGACRGLVCRALLAEAGLLALGGGMLGSALAALSVYLFRHLLASSLEVPFLFPSLARLGALTAQGLALALAGVALAALLPALNISRAEPALAMRE